MCSKALSIIVFILLAFSCQVWRPSTVKSKKNPVSYTVFKSKDGSFGYDIIEEGKIVIHQPYIPVIPGNHGFLKKKQAKLVAKNVIDKISNGIFPPSLSREEVELIIGKKPN